MAWLRDPVVRTGAMPAMQAYLERSFQALDSFLLLLEGRVLQLERLRAIVGVRIRYAWDDTIDTVATPAASGFVKGNNANAASITEFSISRFDTLGRLAILAGIFDTPREDGFVQIENFTRDTRWSFDITGAVIARADDVLVPVVNIVAIGAPAQTDDRVELTYFPEGFQP